MTSHLGLMAIFALLGVACLRHADARRPARAAPPGVRRLFGGVRRPLPIVAGSGYLLFACALLIRRAVQFFVRMFDNLLFAREGAVALVTLNRPQSLNALNTATPRRSPPGASAGARGCGLRAVVITGAGEKAFAAGADIASSPALQPGRDAGLCAARPAGVRSASSSSGSR